MEDREIEVKFLEIDKEAMRARLRALGAADRGEELISEIIFYDPDRRWITENKFVRIRQAARGARLTYKESDEESVDGTIEIELSIESLNKGKKFLQAVGLVASREQEKRRHSFVLDQVMIDIDTWPQVPTYIELEGESEAALKAVAEKLGLDWSKKVVGTAGKVIEEHYGIPVRSYQYFTFTRSGP
ncbi:MAG: hypothetical protein A2722_03590 [Candidatus Doudnabacteria bacterium RIFCSPHIGHO2_01_FULL_50_11]|uniref:CYTH domain-containing protein n=1 Tax=Candidatus Doudnabacteria bacterium RIFCSPHIGHO2_01_FULL_50_11 TaxID=1817828 RepID=A0A1F5PIG5_9BACT|nr:MAG: hypothetical protein A2722_03590 [Candidatus Doudnabacteria bacterium RIFCSPHIGHO2_01_FULL_50_11]HLC44859.1 class IV adenylate cyclase [Patescibacteria group bacterium]